MGKRESFSTRLKMAREVRGWSTRRLDEEAGVAVGRTWQIESGRKPNVEAGTSAKYAKALGVSLDWLLLGAGEGPHPPAT